MKQFEALRQGDNLDFWGNANPKCPHCGTEHSIDRNEWYELYDDNDRHSVTCPKCELDFTVRTACSYTFSTDEQEDFVRHEEGSAGA